LTQINVLQCSSSILNIEFFPAELAEETCPLQLWTGAAGVGAQEANIFRTSRRHKTSPEPEGN